MAIQKRVKWNGNQEHLSRHKCPVTSATKPSSILDDVQSPPAKEQEQIIAKQQMIFTAIPLNIFRGLK